MISFIICKWQISKRCSFLSPIFFILGFVFAVLALSLSQPAGAQSRLPSFEKHFSSSDLGPVQSLEGQHFKVQWVHPRDEALAAPLLQYMEDARSLLVSVFGETAVHSKEKAPIEIFPDLPSFSALSGLSLARFRATGTIALTLEQRLMILSPRNLVSGYPWAETSVHEYIHFLIREISPDHIPIWLHEGVAQLFQGYPYVQEASLKPSQWGLFKRRRDQMKLLDLKTLREPFPYRETPEEAELAYIQALLFAQWLDGRCGVLKLIRLAGQKASVDKAMEACVGQSMSSIESRFVSEIMGGIALPEGPTVEFYARDFSSTDPLEKEGEAANIKARNMAQLSSEIFRQGRFRASALQMQKALEETPVSPPSWRRQMAQAFLNAGQTKDSERVLSRLLEEYPDDAGAWYLVGEIRQKEGNVESAWQAFVNAFFRNPFLESLQERMQRIQETSKEVKDFRLR